MKRSLTLIVTADCTARCSYCYVSRDEGEELSWETARAAVGCWLRDPKLLEGADGGVVDFIGGEPLMRADLIDRVIGHVNAEAFRLGHPWFGAIDFAISSNGHLYLTPKAQRLTRWKRLEVMLSLDGPEDVHDSQRGAGTHARTMLALESWRRQYPHTGTKVTLVPATLPHLARSVMYLLDDLGLPMVHANPVFEPVWSLHDATAMEQQLAELAERMHAAQIALERCSLFAPWVGRPATTGANWCGAGKWMLAVGARGDFYPCFRFSPRTLHRDPMVVGNVRDGIDWRALQPFFDLTASVKSPEACRRCEVSGGCAWCTGYDFDEAGTILHRATHICELHKARSRVNEKLRRAGWLRSDGEKPK